MPRRKRSGKFGGCCYHITHRCQERRFLLRFEKDRKNYVDRLRETQQKYPVEILNYMVTSNHIHLLVWSESPIILPQAMQFLQGSTAQDYNRRKDRQGAFWSGRYHATLIEDGYHLNRCLFYIDMNMIRNGVVDHPSDWLQCGHQELAGNKQRKLIINAKRLLNCLHLSQSPQQFSPWYKLTLEEKLSETYHVREAFWSEAFAVGSESWVTQIAGPVPPKFRSIEKVPSPKGVREEQETYILSVTPRKQAAYLKSLAKI